MSAAAATCTPCDLGAHEGCRGRDCDCCGVAAIRAAADVARAVEGNEAWVAALVAYVARLPPGTRFTTDRLWWHAEEADLAPPRDRRAMGGVMRKAQERRLVQLDPGARTYRSVRPDCHGRFVTVWMRVGGAAQRPACECLDDGMRPEPVNLVDDGGIVRVCPACGFSRKGG